MSCDRRGDWNRRTGERPQEIVELMPRLRNCRAIESDPQGKIQTGGEHPRRAGEHNGSGAVARRSFYGVDKIRN
jgi:hypothetical protein